MARKVRRNYVGRALLVLLTLTLAISYESRAADPQLIASKTQRYEAKQGFERDPKDIINTLRDNDVTQFNTLLDGLQRSFGLDKTLKGAGPYTLFAPSDRAFNQMPQEDLQNLFANPDKLKQVLSYHVVSGKLSGQELRSLKTVKTLEGHDLTVGIYNGDLYADKALVRWTDIPCANGVIHVLDKVVMPALDK
jgi:uncharacterized surface protein with fasciclin (FAS1) repeats